jgi:hypothetical protein
MTGAVSEYLNLLDTQRETLFNQMGALPDPVLWFRPGPKVWSIGEHLDHTRVLNKSFRRLLPLYFPVASLFARPFRRRPYRTQIDDVYKRPNFPMNVGWVWPPKYTPERPVTIDVLHDVLKAEHDAIRRFYSSKDEALLGHTRLADPAIGILNLIQGLRVLAYHDAHHYERVRVRIEDPRYGPSRAPDIEA